MIDSAGATPEQELALRDLDMKLAVWTRRWGHHFTTLHPTLDHLHTLITHERKNHAC